ncbi:hypothetical protein BO71DRAFT_200049 [Aspergillus ellipticus CBS 707.79]|uniref:rRNA-processing protein EFG1 n=1 Tax=Aspergillus ellipticus CBS 707.79 TaxID=1448320 RepID=A0A319DDQ8_9EURO|nr:hypothetical protein BO71DRAFT_200049 [Aspergillus ellipticus CBS 707.79]
MPREYAPRSAKRKDRDFSDDHEDDGPQHARKKINLPKIEHKYPSVNDLKKRIRDVKRLLNKADLPADARIVQERALAGYEKDLDDELKRRDRSKMIKKYHFVRFLDRKTATKDISRLQRREKEITKNDASLDSATQSKKLAALAEKLRVARINLNYTIYYPLTEKYIALYATEQRKKAGSGGKTDGGDDEKDEDDDARLGPIHATVAEKPAMWHAVEKCMREKTLDLLRDGKLDAAAGGEKKKKKRSEQKSSSSSSSRKTEDRKRTKTVVVAAKKEQDTKMRDADDGGDDSDGGFFEM